MTTLHIIIKYLENDYENYYEKNEIMKWLLWKLLCNWDKELILYLS